jgi:hypothetical protein
MPADDQNKVLRARTRLLAVPKSRDSKRGVGLAEGGEGVGGFIWVIVAQSTVDVAGMAGAV